MDRDLEKFLINTLSTSFTNIGVALRLLLEARAEKEEEKIVNVKELENQVKRIPEEKKEQTEKKSASKQKARKAAEAPRTEEVTEVEAPVVSAENKTEEEAVITPVTEEAKAEGPAKVEEPKHKTTLIDVRKIMTDLTKRGKGDIIQKVLIDDFKVSKLSDVKEEDYDDFVARVQYYADELEVENA